MWKTLFKAEKIIFLKVALIFEYLQQILKNRKFDQTWIQELALMIERENMLNAI
jgi:hypothetical protein